MSNKRIRGVAVYRPVLIGSTSTPLSPIEKITSPADHTHKWTVAVRSAASHPLPPLQPSAAAGHGSDEATTTAGISTRGRELETDYHKMVGGKDDISHFIKRVQFKLHDTYPQPTRSIEKPPFQVTETGWGEFEIQIKIFFVSEANEKPITTFHHLKLHPWSALPPGQAAVAAAEAAAAAEGEGDGGGGGGGGGEADAAAAPSDDPATAMDVDDKVGVDETADLAAAAAIDVDAVPEGAQDVPASTAPDAAAAAAVVPLENNTTDTDVAHHPTMLGRRTTTGGGGADKPAVPVPPVVHSWQYDELVFPEPTEAFYEVLMSHTPTPLPPTSAAAFTDATAFAAFQAAQRQSTPSSTPAVPSPHPVHAPTGYLAEALSQEAQAAETERLEAARVAAVRELENGREQLIRAEKTLRDVRAKLAVAGGA